MSRNNKEFLKSVTAYAPIFIALVALFLSIWQAHQYRRHNQLSVRPFVQLIREMAAGEPVNGLLVTNAGFGPAIIKDFRIYVDGKVMPDDDDNCGWTHAIRLLNLKRRPVENFCLAKGGSIRAGETYPLLSIKKEYLTRDDFRFLKKAIRRVHLCIQYASLYDEEFGERCEEKSNN
jgi:hypothetical protein